MAPPCIRCTTGHVLPRLLALVLATCALLFLSASAMAALIASRRNGAQREAAPVT